MDQTTKEWEQYQNGIAYKNKINLYSNNDKNERFYALKHWEGVNAPGMPKAMFPVMNRVIDYKVSTVLSNQVSINYTLDGIDETNEDYQKLIESIKDISDYSKTLWERLKQDDVNEEAILNGALSGDSILYYYWDERIKSADGVEGDINVNIIDNVNYFPGNPNERKINDAYGPVQPYIILAFRKMLSEVRKEARIYNEKGYNKLTKEEILNISADTDTTYQTGDRAKQELEGDDGKCIVLLKLWQDTETETIHAIKSVRNYIIREEWDTKLTRYPVALMNWKIRKNSAHGEAEATGLINNQIAINKLASQIQLWIMLHAYPKLVYDKTKLPDGWNNDITKAIGVIGDVEKFAQYLTPQQISAVVESFFDKIIILTKEMFGANETALGDNSVTQTYRGIISLQEANAKPLDQIKHRYYQFNEDIALIWLDFWINKYSEYPKRMLQINRDNKTLLVPFNTNLKDKLIRTKIDITPTNRFNKDAIYETVDGLKKGNIITDIEFLERIPDEYIPKKQELIDTRQQENEDKQFIYVIMEQWLKAQPPQVQQQLGLLEQQNPEEFEMKIKQMMLQNLT